MAETSITAATGFKRLDFDKARPRDRRDYQLGDSIAGTNDYWFFAEIDQDDFEFATVVGVYSSGRINHRQPFLDRPPAARPNLAFVARWNFDGNAGGDGGSGQGTERDFGINVRHQVDSGRTLAVVTGQRQGTLAEAAHFYRYFRHVGGATIDAQDDNSRILWVR